MQTLLRTATTRFLASRRQWPTRLPPLRNKYSSAPTSFPDPSRENLFYHLIQPPSPLSRTLPAFAISFLPDPPPTSDSCTVVGWLPASGAAATGEQAENESEGEGGAGLNDFKENPKFRALLHEAIQTGLREDVDEIQSNGAKQLQYGWMHVHDDRNVPALGRIGDPDDIIASVLVEDSQILSETYQPMPAYRLCTSDGLTQLTPGLAEHLYKLLRERARQGR